MVILIVDTPTHQASISHSSLNQYANAIGDLWSRQFTLKLNPTEPCRPKPVKDILQQKRAAEVHEGKAAFKDRGVGTMADGLDPGRLHDIAFEFWSQNSEVRKRDLSG